MKLSEANNVPKAVSLPPSRALTSPSPVDPLNSITSGVPISLGPSLETFAAPVNVMSVLAALTPSSLAELVEVAPSVSFHQWAKLSRATIDAGIPPPPPPLACRFCTINNISQNISLFNCLVQQFPNLFCVGL